MSAKHSYWAWERFARQGCKQHSEDLQTSIIIDVNHLLKCSGQAPYCINSGQELVIMTFASPWKIRTSRILQTPPMSRPGFHILEMGSCDNDIQLQSAICQRGGSLTRTIVVWQGSAPRGRKQHNFCERLTHANFSSCKLFNQNVVRMISKDMATAHAHADGGMVLGWGIVMFPEIISTTIFMLNSLVVHSQFGVLSQFENRSLKIIETFKFRA
jgi:hypothetical protein